jgi:maleate cis-trans isomerase
MLGWRARIGVLVPPGNPTVEPEFYRMAPAGVTVHFGRLEGFQMPGIPGAPGEMERRTLAYLEALPGPARALGAVRPAVVVLAHTASSYATGFAGEPALVDRITTLTGAPALTAAGAVLAALRCLGVRRLALGSPYPDTIGALARAYWAGAGFEILGMASLAGTENIYGETEARAYELGRRADVKGADAVLLSGTGLPTVGVIEALEHDLGKPVISSTQAAVWQALRMAGVHQPISGFGRLLRDPREGP